MRQHFGEHHDWQGPTMWNGVMDWTVWVCSICGLVSQQPHLESEIDTVPFIVLRPSPVGMPLDAQVPDPSITVSDTHRGNWSFPEGKTRLTLEGVVTGSIVVREGQDVDVQGGSVGELIVDGGSAQVWSGGEVTGDVRFIDGVFRFIDGTIRGSIRTDVVSSLNSMERGTYGHTWEPNGLYDPPTLFVNYNANLVGGISGL